MPHPLDDKDELKLDRAVAQLLCYRVDCAHETTPSSGSAHPAVCLFLLRAGEEREAINSRTTPRRGSLQSRPSGVYLWLSGCGDVPDALSPRLELGEQGTGADQPVSPCAAAGGPHLYGCGLSE